MWIARDKGGTLWIFERKPKKCRREWYATGHAFPIFLEFPEIRWEDDEPSEIEITIKQ